MLRVVHAIRVEVIELELDSAGKVRDKRSSLSHYEGGWPADRVDDIFNKLSDLIVSERKATTNVTSTRRPLKSDAAKGVRARRALRGSRNSRHDR